MTDSTHKQGLNQLTAVPKVVLEELTSLNTRFIELLCHQNSDFPNLAIDQLLYQQLIALEKSNHQRLASCPYSLFDLHLSDLDWWQHNFATTPSIEQPTPESQFTLAAMIYAQRIALENPDLGGVLLGMSPGVWRLFRLCKMGELIYRCDAVANKLHIRLGNNSNFWPDLINFVREETPTKYLAAQTSALQILAARH